MGKIENCPQTEITREHTCTITHHVANYLKRRRIISTIIAAMNTSVRGNYMLCVFPWDIWGQIARHLRYL